MIARKGQVPLDEHAVRPAAMVRGGALNGNAERCNPAHFASHVIHRHGPSAWAAVERNGIVPQGRNLAGPDRGNQLKIGAVLQAQEGHVSDAVRVDAAILGREPNSSEGLLHFAEVRASDGDVVDLQAHGHLDLARNTQSSPSGVAGDFHSAGPAASGRLVSSPVRGLNCSTSYLPAAESQKPSTLRGGSPREENSPVRDASMKGFPGGGLLSSSVTSRKSYTSTVTAACVKWPSA